jgi:hypothetical protein
MSKNENLSAGNFDLPKCAGMGSLFFTETFLQLSFSQLFTVIFYISLKKLQNCVKN